MSAMMVLLTVVAGVALRCESCFLCMDIDDDDDY